MHRYPYWDFTAEPALVDKFSRLVSETCDILIIGSHPLLLSHIGCIF